MQSPPGRSARSSVTAGHAACIVLALMLPIAGCVSGKTVQDLERRIQDLERENFRLQKDLAEARVRRQMERERRSGATAASGGGAQQPAAAAEEPLLTMNDSAPASHVIESELITDASAWTGSGSGAAPSRKQARGGAPERLMDAAQASLDARDAESALAHFKDIVANHPDSAFADDAQFGVGECYFQMGRYEDAIVEYRRVAEQFPFGDRVAYAYLKVGFSQLALDQRDAALESFRTVSEAYPGTEAATVARQQIGHLSRR